MQLTSIDSDIPKNLQEIIRFLKENEIVNISSLKQQIEEFKKLQILKDNEISKLNDIILSRKNEIDKYQKIIEEQKKGTRESQIEEEYKNEKEKLIIILLYLKYISFKWGLGIGDWGLGIEEWGLGLIFKTK